MLTRKMLKAMGIEDEKIDQIIEAHTESTDALKADRDKYREEAEKVPELQEEIETLQGEKENLQKEIEENGSYKEKYEDEHNAFEDYKKGVDADKEKARKAEAYRELLKKAGISEKRIDAIMKITDVSGIKFDEEGNVIGSDEIIDKIKEDWSEFVVTESTKGVDTETPPKNTGGKMTKEEIMAIKDRNERQKAISENLDLFNRKG